MVSALNHGMWRSGRFLGYGPPAACNLEPVITGPLPHREAPAGKEFFSFRR